MKKETFYNIGHQFLQNEELVAAKRARALAKPKKVPDLSISLHYFLLKTIYIRSAEFKKKMSPIYCDNRAIYWVLIVPWPNLSCPDLITYYLA
jgi:hypothetical protein